jgi:hypothetical protein
MDDALEQIRLKINELETKLSDLHTTERELSTLERRKSPRAEAPPKRPVEAGRKAKQQPVIEAPPEKNQTMGAAVIETLTGHDPLTVAEIAEAITASGRPIENRAISFTLQALKKRGLAIGINGKWTVPKTRGRKKAQAVPVEAEEAESSE